MRPNAALCAVLVSAAHGVAWAAPAKCADAIQEFALVAQMDMRDEAVRQYSRLDQGCKAALKARAGQSALPASGNSAAIIAFGKSLYQARRASSSAARSAALKGADIPQVDGNALTGVGPDNIEQALSGMALDVLASAAGSRNERQTQSTLSRLADQVRGKERKWAAGAGSSGGGGPSSDQLPTDPPIPLPADAVAKASCSGNLDFLLPLLRDYRDPELAGLRRGLLSGTVNQAIQAARQQGLGKAQAIELLRQQALEHDQGSAEGALTANQTDALGESSIPQARNDQLPLDFPCSQGASIHAAGVCMYISSRWESLAARAYQSMFERCW